MYEVLVADDDPSILLLLRALQELEDIRVTTAVDGVDALDKARAGDFDVFVFDVMMPIMDGLELTRAVREDPQTEDTPIIICSARVDDESRARAKATGASLYLTKPVSMNDLGNAIIELAGGRKKRRRRKA